MVLYCTRKQLLSCIPELPLPDPDPGSGDDHQMEIRYDGDYDARHGEVGVSGRGKWIPTEGVPHLPPLEDLLQKLREGGHGFRLVSCVSEEVSLPCGCSITFLSRGHGGTYIRGSLFYRCPDCLVELRLPRDRLGTLNVSWCREGHEYDEHGTRLASLPEAEVDTW